MAEKLDSLQQIADAMSRYREHIIAASKAATAPYVYIMFIDKTGEGILSGPFKAATQADLGELDKLVPQASASLTKALTLPNQATMAHVIAVRQNANDSTHVFLIGVKLRAPAAPSEHA